MSTNKTKITIKTLMDWKKEGRRIPMLTCYDFTTAVLMAEAGVDVILTGDTYGEVCLGHPSTLPVTLDQMITITEAVRRGAPNAFLIGDMPFLTCQVSVEDSIRNAGRMMAETGCDCIKFEGDRQYADTVRAISATGIPVMVHLGLRPQSIHQYGGYRAQGKTAENAVSLIEDARIMEEAGAVALLLEAIPQEVARMITERTSLPVIGCIAGPYCDGNVIVLHDMLGYTAGHPPTSIKRYANVHDILTNAFATYVQDVTKGVYPAEEHGISMSSDEVAKLNALIESSCS